MSKYLIVGGVAGGMSCAARLRRLSEDAKIIVFERGEFVSFANCGLPYYIGGKIREKSALVLQTPESFKNRFNVDVRVLSEVVRIDPAAKKITVKDIYVGREYEETYDKLILSPGAEPVRPDILGIEHPAIFTLRNIPDTLKIKNFIETKKPSTAIVVGGGYIGLEMAENLVEAGLHVTVVEALPQVLNVIDPDIAAMAGITLKNNKIILKTGVGGVLSFDDNNGGVRALLSNGQDIKADLVIWSAGVKPEISLAKDAGLKTNRGIVVDEYLRTSDENIYAVGDAIEVKNPVTGVMGVMPLAGPANKQGRLCADNIIEGNKRKYKGTLGASVLKIFNVTVAAVGPPSKVLDALKIPYETVTVHPGSHAGYYPGAASMTLKLIFSPSDGRILGAQAAGVEFVDKKIDVISAIMGMKGTVYDLMEFEQCYAPPYSSAKDAVNMAGFVAENVLSGRIKTITWEKVLANQDDFIILDVRTGGECGRGKAPGAINIPVDDLRQRIGEIPKGKKIAVHCGVGIRSYIAVRILMQSGFEEVFNISGGYISYAILKA
jgi:NADPH-dependent 2,4-dienoyl-CoA reductase/sulfur reductase-like enzyme/rhodanese-related sulfurtransferase